MDKRHSPKVDTAGVHPVMTMAGIMPGGSEMRHWHNWVPFPDPDAIARELAAGNARTHAEMARQAEVTGTPPTPDGARRLLPASRQLRARVRLRAMPVSAG